MAILHSRLIPSQGVGHPVLSQCVSDPGIPVNLGHWLVDIHSRSSVFAFDKSSPSALQGHLTVSLPTTGEPGTLYLV